MCRFSNCHTYRRAEPACTANIRDVSDAAHAGTPAGHAPKCALTFKQKALTALLAIFVVSPALYLSLLGLLTVHSLHSEQRVAGRMTVASDWVEITPPRPLRPTKRSHEIVLDVAEPLPVEVDWHGRAVLPDGTALRPEVALVNERGEVVPVEVWRTPVPSRYDNAISGHVPDGVYVEVRVRCDQPLRLRRIVWHCWDSK